MLRVREAIIAGRDRSSCSPSLFWRFESFGANPANRQLGPAFAAWPPVPADLLFAEIRTILPSALRVPRGLRPSQDHPVQARRDAGGQVFANQASFASLTNRRALRRCSSAKQKVDEYSAPERATPGTKSQPIPSLRSVVATILKSTRLPMIRSMAKPIGNIERNAPVSASAGKVLASSTVLLDPPAREER